MKSSLPLFSVLQKETMMNDSISQKNDVCLINSLVENNSEKSISFPENRAVLGPAHAASGAGIASIVLGFLAIAGGPFIAALTLLKVLLVMPGAALSPDLDSNTSTAKNSMGIIGSILSYFYRSSSYVIQKIIRTKRDNPNPNPHRGFWHTIVGAFAIGLLTYWASSINIIVYKDYTLGFVLGCAIAGALLSIGLNGVAKGKIKKLKNVPIIGDFLVWVLSVALVFALQISSDNYLDFKWLSIALTIGAIIHIFGDSITKKGVPIFFPITGFTKGKFWWDTRFASYDAGDEGLNSFIFSFSIILSVIGIVLYSLAYFAGVNLGLL